MKILITGASGFIGSKLIRRALDRGHQVAALDLPGTRLPAALAGASGMEWLEGTLEAAPWAAIDRFQPELCAHCAWTTAPRYAYDSPEHFKCLEASKTFLRRAAESGVKHIVGVGTCIEYRLGPEPLREDQTPLEPVGAYAESKDRMRAWLETEAPKLGMRFGWGRIFYVYGAGEDPTRLCTATARKLANNEPIVLKTPSSTKDYIYVDDVVSALWLLAEQKAAGAFNIGTGKGISIFELASTLGRILGKEDLVRKAVPEAPDPLGYVVSDNSKLRALGWGPAFHLERGLRALLKALNLASDLPTR